MIKRFVPLALIVTIIFGTIYTVSQQVLRLTANDPQIQVASDLARDAAAGNTITADSRKVDLALSLSPFVIVLDDKLNIKSSNAYLEGKQPLPPKGVFDYAKTNLDDRVTWQPKKGVRLALVVKYFEGKQKGYIAVGRSLAEVEKRSDDLLKLTGFGLAAALGILIWFTFFKWE